MNKPLNTTGLSALRHADAEGFLPCDGSTGLSLIARGFAVENTFPGRPQSQRFMISGEGRKRAKFKADVIVHRDGVKDDPSLLEDLP